VRFDLKDLSPVKKRLSVEVDADEVERETEGVLRDYRARAKIPGFRPGKAPMSVIRSRFAKDAEEDVRERIVSRYFLEGARERGLHPLGNPALDEIHHQKGEPLRFQTTFEVLPAIEPRAYSGIEVRRVVRTAADRDVDEVLEDIRQSRARLVSEEGRQAAAGDVLFVDLDGAPDGGEPFRREGAPIEIGAAGNLPGFDAALLGSKAGDEREVTVDVPADYPGRDLAGRRVAFRLVVREVKRKEVPAADDELAREVGDFEDLAGLRRRILSDLESRNRREADKAVRQSLLDKVLLENPVVLPDILVEDEIRRRLEDGLRGLILRGVDVERAGIDWEKLRKSQEEPARKAVHARLMLDAIARAQSITADEGEVDARIAEEARHLGEEPRRLRTELRKDGRHEALRTQLVREKTLDYLTSVAKIQDEE
jgi:trigger factor